VYTYIICNIYIYIYIYLYLIWGWIWALFEVWNVCTLACSILFVHLHWYCRHYLPYKEAAKMYVCGPSRPLKCNISSGKNRKYNTSMGSKQKIQRQAKSENMRGPHEVGRPLDAPTTWVATSWFIMCSVSVFIICLPVHYLRRLHTVDGINWATPCQKYIGLARPMFFCFFIPASRSHDWSNSIRLENSR